MKIIGLTGGIGSGKTTVATMFSNLGIPVYIADDEAKKLMVTSKIIKRKLIALFGKRAYTEDQLNRPFIANIIFNDKTYLEKMNAIVHPKVANHFKKWVSKQKTPYVIKEAAILFENGNYKQCDAVITVVAPKKMRIERVLKRDTTTKDKINAIMQNQWTDEHKIKLSDYVIKNTLLANTQAQVCHIHNTIIGKNS
ncbi:MAG: dephospho-CoA kinase [Flavobacteriaceae bacterium]